MRSSSAFLVCILAVGCDSPPTVQPAASEKQGPVEISIKDLPDKKVLIGQLGVPFGTIVRAKCRGIVPTEKELKRT